MAAVAVPTSSLLLAGSWRLCIPSCGPQLFYANFLFSQSHAPFNPGSAHCFPITATATMFGSEKQTNLRLGTSPSAAYMQVTPARRTQLQQRCIQKAELDSGDGNPGYLSIGLGLGIWICR
ncbi:hypothetical protein K402DRAFT_397395 [Aulographum hederae CBS 113979]|uniref:Secreted protein n=1 Tax=Aulographum hederae CBS 113979 TaxID=1176131 RepID=A0A6G1GPC6_9PEZI|nr:hypothetical protein K402DRAFT_397395 [Aulographum hederae CBS 113979]